MSIIPNYLVILIVALVIIPAVVAVFLRMVLHYHLTNQGNQVWRLIYGKVSGSKPRLIQDLESRLAQARRELERVNTGALIDHIYSQERVFFISCEQVDYFTRILPNLLLSFGLLGTFVGITINLAALSQAVSATDSTDLSSLLQQIQQPLQGMGIAFITSLTAILFSAFLTIVNFLFNTTFAKNKLLSALEDYLDNIYQPTLKGETHLDKIVQGMVNTFDRFLHQFSQSIQGSIQAALQEKIQEVSEAQIKTNQLAEQVYHRLMEASLQVTQSSENFQQTTNKFMEAAQAFERSQFPQTLSSATTNLANTQRNFSQSASTLSASVQSVDLAMIELQNYSKRLIKFGEQMNQTNQTSQELIEAHRINQQSLGEMTQQLQNATQGFQLAMNTLDILQRRMVTRTESLEEIHSELTKLVIAIERYTETVRLELNKLGDRLTQGTIHSTANNPKL
ncbi:hypothetical protein ACL6C3_06520 [Capilliphycus salinus ALCB114379]|uniref:hypothetical protein n=1 Tax=Capilliphycus salinus TaxID=2768948 RepID=UPI0039A4F4D0